MFANYNNECFFYATLYFVLIKQMLVISNIKEEIIQCTFMRCITEFVVSFICEKKL